MCYFFWLKWHLRDVKVFPFEFKYFKFLVKTSIIFVAVLLAMVAMVTEAACMCDLNYTF